SKENELAKFIKMIGLEEEKVVPDSPLSVASESEMKIIFAYHIYLNNVDWLGSVEAVDNAINYANSKMAHDDNIELMEGAYEFLKGLHYSGKKIGVITADTKANAQRHFNKVGILKWIDFIIGSDCVERSKPFPDMLDIAEEKYDVKMKDTIFFGDSKVDVRMAELKCLNKIVGVNNSELKADFHI